MQKNLERVSITIIDDQNRLVVTTRLRASSQIVAKTSQMMRFVCEQWGWSRSPEIARNSSSTWMPKFKLEQQLGRN